ncbi:MAG: beta strand repeat-containing protein [Phycisphaerales bacterium]
MTSSLRAAALVLVAGTVTAAQGAILQWDALFNGNASTASNWNPNQRPTAVDDLRFNSTLNNNYTVTYDSLVPTVRSHQYLGDNVTIRTSFPHSITNTMSIENGSEILLETSALHVGGSTAIGATSVSGGRFTIEQSLFTGQQLHLGAIGTADVIVSVAGRLEVPTVTLRGDSSLTLLDTSVAELSTLTIGNSSNASASSVLVSDGAGMTLLGGITMSPVAGSSSVLRIIEGPDLTGTQIDAQGDVLIGANTGAAAAGTAIVTLGDMTAAVGLSELICDDLVVGDVHGGQGTLSLQSGTVRCASATFVGGHSSLVIERGLLDCSGPFIWENGPLAIDGLLDSTLFLRGEATLNHPLKAGVLRDGRITVFGPSADVTVNGDLTVGEQASSEGTLDVANSGTLAVNGGVHIGVAGVAELFARDGANAFANVITAAANPGSRASITIVGAIVSSFDGLFLGGSATAQGGSVDVTITNGLLGGQDVVRCWGGTSITMNNGDFQTNTTIDMRPGSSLTMNPGVVLAPTLLFTGAATPLGDSVDLTGSGHVDAAVSSTGLGNNIVATGPLILGRSDSLTGYNGGSIALSVGAHTVTLLDANTASVGDTTIAAGTIAAPNGITFSGTRTISGGGTIDAPTITNLGTINATTPQGFILKGIVSGAGTLTGTLFDFSNTGGFTGAGAINSQIRGTSGSVITATGNLTLGTATSTGFSFDGTIRTNANQVTLRDTSVAAVGDVELAGGFLFCNDTDLSSDISDITSGFGTIGVSPRTWIAAGTIRPNGAGVDVTGQLSVVGNVNMENFLNSSVVDMEIGGTAAANMDKFVVLGALTIDGTLRVRFVPGYVPFGGEVYTLLTANSVSGNFTTLDLPPRTRVIVNPTNVQVEALCPSDQNADGNVDGDDVIDLFAAWDLGLPIADTNGDGSVDGDDVIVFFEHWDAGC